VNIAVTSPSFSKNKTLQNKIYSYFPDAKLNLEGKPFNKRELIEYIGEAEGLIVGLDKIDKEVLNGCPNLKIISKYGVGLNNIDLNGCKERNIAIGWSGGVNRLSVAEMTLGYILMLSRNLYITSNQLKRGVWNKNGGFELSGKIVGIIGVGFIGKELIRLLEPFRCKILVNDIINQNRYYKKYNLIESSKDEIYKNADIITLHTPLNSTTNNMITLKEMKIMKKSAILINSARGGLINEDDLKFALQNNIIAGGAIDVYINEPPTNKELIEIPNLITTPHIGGNSKEAVLAMGMSAIEHLRKFFNV